MENPIVQKRMIAVHKTGPKTESSNKRSGASVREQFLLSDEGATNQSAPATAGEVSSGRSGRKGGPRTLQGKQKSKHNAVKHGNFSQQVLLKGESPAEYNSLLKGYQNCFKPEGAPEEETVARLADIDMRRRRLSLAYGADIRKATEFVEWDEKRRQDDDAAKIHDFQIKEQGLVQKIANPKVLEACLDLLKQLKAGIKTAVFHEETDKFILARLYGESGPATAATTLFDEYLSCLSAAPTDAGVRAQDEDLTREDRRAAFLHSLESEIRRLELYGRKQALIQSKKINVEVLRGNVPDTPQFDRLLRYESHLDRTFDRILNLLERLQRSRKGLPTPPTLNVKLDS